MQQIFSIYHYLLDSLVGTRNSKINKMKSWVSRSSQSARGTIKTGKKKMQWEWQLVQPLWRKICNAWQSLRWVYTTTQQFNVHMESMMFVILKKMQTSLLSIGRETGKLTLVYTNNEVKINESGVSTRHWPLIYRARYEPIVWSLMKDQSLWS